jgi:hypothetical protein
MEPPLQIICVGIDPTAGNLPITYAIVDQDCQLISLAAGEMEELLSIISSHPSVFLAVNAPHGTNLGLVKKTMGAGKLLPGRSRGLDLRMAEFDLRQRGILISPTPSHSESCPAWMQMGFDLYRNLENAGYKYFSGNREESQVLETHPHAAFCSLLGKLPLPKPSLEGRLQRHVLLFEQKMGIKDPMVFFEEITAHKIVHGNLPVEFIYSAEELDALAAAFVAFKFAIEPENVHFVGEMQEGQIALPVKELKEKYD